MNTQKWVIDPKNFRGSAYTFLNSDGLCPYSKKTESEFISEGYEIVTDDEFLKMSHNWEDSICGDWKEITEEIFYDMLGVVPPIGWYDDGFFMGEMYTGKVGTFYQKINDKFYTSLQRITTPRRNIIDSLLKFLSRL